MRQIRVSCPKFSSLFNEELLARLAFRKKRTYVRPYYLLKRFESDPVSLATFFKTLSEWGMLLEELYLDIEGCSKIRLHDITHFCKLHQHGKFIGNQVYTRRTNLSDQERKVWLYVVSDAIFFLRSYIEGMLIAVRNYQIQYDDTILLPQRLPSRD